MVNKTKKYDVKYGKMATEYVLKPIIYGLLAGGTDLTLVDQDIWVRYPVTYSADRQKKLRNNQV